MPESLSELLYDAKTLLGINEEKSIGYVPDPWELQIPTAVHIAKCANSVVRLRKKARLCIIIEPFMNKARLFTKMNEKKFERWLGLQDDFCFQSKNLSLMSVCCSQKNQAHVHNKSGVASSSPLIFYSRSQLRFLQSISTK